MAGNALIVIVTVIAFNGLCLAGNVDLMESIPDLEKAMYFLVDGAPCVRLLNRSAEIGCANPSDSKVVAPIVRINHASSELVHRAAYLLPFGEMSMFLTRVSDDRQLAEKVAGVLVESAAKELLGPLPAGDFLRNGFTTYRKPTYKRDSLGGGIMWKRYNFPVILLSKNSTIFLQKVADKSPQNADVYPMDVAELDFVMQTTKAGTLNSESCLKHESCLPLGGYSVLSSLPAPDDTLPSVLRSILLVITSKDSASFFRDEGSCAPSTLSGMISLLAIVDALSHANLQSLKKQVVFLFLAGEPWGHLGSRRFLAELDAGAISVTGLNHTLIEQVLEIGSVGMSSRDGETTFFTHTHGDSSAAENLSNSFMFASQTLKSFGVKLKKAGLKNSAVLSSSLMPFLRQNVTAGIVFEDFDLAFANKSFRSRRDCYSNTSSSSIVAAASLLARAIYIIASDTSGIDGDLLDSISVNASLVEELVACLLSCDPGLSCGLVKDLIYPTRSCSSHYVGVLRSLPSAYPELVDDTSRFIWNFLADRTSVVGDSSGPCRHGCKNAQEVCVRADIESQSRCVATMTRYVPAYSTRLGFEGGCWQILPQNASDAMGHLDPVWTESYWYDLRIRVYTIQSKSYDRLVLSGGIGITVLVHILTIAARGILMKALKED